MGNQEEKTWHSFPFPSEGRGAIVQQVAEVIRDGRVMAYPTETAYALGGNALNQALVEAIYRLKGREDSKALLLLVDGIAGAEQVAREISSGARCLMEAFWPGPLTIVLFAAPDLPSYLPDERGTVAVRWSPNPAVEALLQIGGVPLIGTSANLSGQPTAQSPAQITAAFGDQIELGVDGGILPTGAPSTIVDTTVQPFNVIRPGVVSVEAIQAVLSRKFPKLVPDA